MSSSVSRCSQLLPIYFTWLLTKQTIVKNHVKNLVGHNWTVKNWECTGRLQITMHMIHMQLLQWSKSNILTLVRILLCHVVTDSRCKTGAKWCGYMAWNTHVGISSRPGICFVFASRPTVFLYANTVLVNWRELKSYCESWS